MAEASKEKSKWFDKKNIVTVILLSVSLSFTVFFFSPTDIFLGNQKEFNISAHYIILPMFLLAVTGSVILMLAGFLSLLHRTAYNVITSLMLGLLLVFYTQMMLFNGDMQILIDTGVSYSQMTLANMLNYIVMYIILVMPVILTLAKEKYSSIRILNIANGKIAPYLSALLFTVQLCGSVGMFISKGLIDVSFEQYAIYGFSFKPFMSVSEDENIAVFLLDRLDGVWMDETLEMYPEMNEKLEGFTFYQNNVSCYSNTFPSVTCMLTNTEYGGTEEAYRFIDRAWEERSLPSILSENGYKVNVLIDQTTTFNQFSQLSECSNIVAIKADDYKINYFGENGIISTMTYLSLAKLSPYSIKDFFVLKMGSFNSDYFITISDELPEDIARSVNIKTDIKFNECLDICGLRADSDQKTFSFIHLDCAHSYSADIARLNPSYTGDINKDVHTTIRGDFETLFTYFDMMKELGVYDDSTIIIVADHGRPKEVNTASLLIKPRNSEKKPLQFDAVSELSNKNFFPSILEYAGIDHSEYGYSYNDIISNEIHSERYLMHAQGNQNYNSMFMVTGDARDESNWTEVPLDK